ncbi:unnamed protein product [Urochloa decumbens]|uniref:Uncharacterized protein n=1 Tax=Urochloa decumbens TaxID=240449 RepID=A0ABC9G9G5_9POAL
MARLLLGGAAVVLLGVGVAAADAAFSSSVRPPRPRAQEGPLFSNVVRTELVDASRAFLSAVLLRAPPLSGERLRSVERAVSRALQEDGGAAGGGATDLRLLLALLAARDGRFDDAMRLYGEAARADPADPRPRALGEVLSALTGRQLVAAAAAELELRWEEDCRYLPAGDAAQLLVLVDELVVAAALGGAPGAFVAGGGGGSSSLPEPRPLFVHAAARRADVGLAAALRDEEMPARKRLQLAALRAFLGVSVESVVKTTTVSVGVPEPKEGEDEGEDEDKETRRPA